MIRTIILKFCKLFSISSYEDIHRTQKLDESSFCHYGKTNIRNNFIISYSSCCNENTISKNNLEECIDDRDSLDMTQTFEWNMKI